MFQRCDVGARWRRQHLEPQRTRRGDCFEQAHFDGVTQPISGARSRADERMGGFDVVIVIVCKARDRNIAVGSGVFEAHEQARPDDACDAGRKYCADLIGEMCGDQPISRFAFGCHRTALGIGNRLGNAGEARDFVVRQSIGSQVKRAYQRPVHEQIGITADRRSKMRVADEVQSEMADVLRRVLGL